MQFLILGYDGTDAAALGRRLAVRPEHLALGDVLRDAGNFWYGAAITDDSGNMIGSVMFMDFPSREELDAWLEREPYVTGNVWQQVEVRNCSVGNPWQFNRPEEFFTQMSPKSYLFSQRRTSPIPKIQCFSRWFAAVAMLPSRKASEVNGLAVHLLVFDVHALFNAALHFAFTLDQLGSGYAVDREPTKITHQFLMTNTS